METSYTIANKIEIKLNFVKSSNDQARNKRYILLNNLGNKHSLVMKFGQFTRDYKRNIFMKKTYKKCGLETSSTPFGVCKELSETSTGY